MMIHLAAIVSATAADILNSTRLQSIPAGGVITIEVISQFNDATNAFTLTVSLPGGGTPIEAQRVSAVNPAIAGVMDSRMSDKYRFPVTQGGHVTVTLTEIGTAIAYYRITYVGPDIP